MNEINHSEVASEISPNDETVGVKLYQKRIAAGLTPLDIANKLKVSLRQVEALEQDRYEALPGNVFTCGFVRSYARLLDLEPETLLHCLKNSLPKEAVRSRLPELHVEKTAIHGGYHRRRVRIQRIGGLLGLIVILLAAGGSVIYYLTPKYAESNHIVESNVPLIASVPLELQADPENLPIKSVPGVIVALPDAPAIPAANTLQIQASQDSWVYIIDHNNDVLFHGIVKKDTLQNLGGTPPYRVKIGNVQHTRLIYDGKAIDLIPFNKNNVAVIDIPLKSLKREEK